MRQRLVLGLEAEHLVQHRRHGVAAERRLLEHELVARVVPDPVDPPHQPVMAHPRGAVLQPAHPLVDQPEQVLQLVGRRRVGGEAAVPRRRPPLDADPLGPGLELRLGDRDQLGQDLGLLGRRRLAAVEDIQRLLEVEQPERQPQVLGADDVGPGPEGGAVLVVHVEHQHPEIGPHLDHLRQDRGDRRRLADPGRADDGEMLRQHVVGVDVGRDRRILAQVPDGDRPRPGRGIDQVQLRAAEHPRRVADRRILAHPAPEPRPAVRGPLDLPEQVDPRHRPRPVDLLGPQADVGDHPDHRGLVPGDRDELAHRRPVRPGRHRPEPDADLRPLHREHPSEAAVDHAAGGNVHRRPPRPAASRHPVRSRLATAPVRAL